MKYFTALGLAVLAIPSVAAAQSAISFTGGTPTSDFPNRTLGFSFTVNSTINIGELGFWDLGGDGLAESHQVGIWDSAGSTLLATAIVPGGTSGTLVDGFRYVSVAPFLLGPGEYLAGAFTGSAGDAVIRFTSATTIPEITLGSTRFDTGFTGVFAPPTGTQSDTFDDGYFGLNFRLANGAVPEPTSWALMIFGFGLVGGAMRRNAARLSYA